MADHEVLVAADRAPERYSLEVLSENFRFFQIDELRRLPPPPWLIPGVLPAHGISIIYGQPGHGKSFLALDWAMCIGSGTSWAGLTIDRQPVVYVAAEGILGYAPRAEAWLSARGLPVGELPNVHFLSHPVHVGERSQDGDIGLDEFEAKLGEANIAPKLVILDTLSRCLAGTDENGTRVVSEMISRCEALATRLQCAFLLVHHTRKRDEEIRGSGVLTGAANMMANVRMLSKEQAIKLTCTKMKDGPKFPPFEFDFIQREQSAILAFNAEATREDAEIVSDGSKPLSANYQFVLDALPAEGASLNGWFWLSMERSKTEANPLSKETIYRAIRTLRERGVVTLDKKCFRRAGQSNLPEPETTAEQPATP